MHEWSFDVPLPIFFVFVATNPRWVPLHDRIWHKTLMGNCFSHMMVHVWWYIQCEIHATPITGFLLFFFFYCVFFWCFGVTMQNTLRHNVETLQKQTISCGFFKKTLKLGSLQTIYYCISTFKLLINIFFYLWCKNKMHTIILIIN